MKVNEASIQEAITDLKSQKKPNFSATAKKYGLERTTLAKRFNGQHTSMRTAMSTHRQRLNNTQESVLIKHINYLTDRGMPPTSQIVHNLAEEIIQGPVGKNWVGEFVKRHKEEITSVYLRNMDYHRVKSEYKPIFKHFYQLLSSGIEKYRIRPENIYNIDEKGFLLGFMKSSKRIMTVRALKSGRVHSAQDGSREFLTILACISATGKALPPGLIYQGESEDLRSNWVEDLKPGDKAFFTTSANGWSCDALGYKWLKQVFEPHTRAQANGRYRLLIVDGHSSHVNMRFIDFADSHKIIVMILPPHTTHRLQPLDVGLFLPLALAYSDEQDRLMQEGTGRVSMSKTLFWGMFWPSWLQSFTAGNITSAFEKTGIWPIEPSIMIKKLFPKPDTPCTTSQPIPTTPITCRGIRRMQKSYMRSPSSTKLQHIMNANYRLSAELSIAQHSNRGLIRALNLQKKKSARSQRLNLYGEKVGEAQWFSTEQVLKAKALLAEKEAQEEAKKEAIIAKRLAAKNRREQLEAEKVRKQLERQLVKEQKAKEALLKKQAREEAQMRKALERQLLATQRKAKKAATRRKAAPKAS